MLRSFCLLFLAFTACTIPAYTPAPETLTPSKTPEEGEYFYTATASVTERVLDSATPSREATQTPTRTPEPAAGVPFEVLIHPDGPLYVGDWISLEVIDLSGDALSGRSIDVTEAATGAVLAEGEGFSPYGVGGRTQATLVWVWDTSGLAVGEHQLRLSVEPDGYVWTETVTLDSRDGNASEISAARWQERASDCCDVHYISGTAADRDAGELVKLVDDKVAQVSRQLGYELNKPLSFTFIPRLLGHGGFAMEDISVAYLDRNYAGSGSDIVLHHEIVHALDSRMGAELRPTILSEGLAVYLSGGHFKQEPLLERAAALLAAQPGCVDPEIWSEDSLQEACSLDWYLPLNELADGFYYEQHEIGYLQAGALVEFMVDTWGWQAFLEFYRDIHPVSEPPPGSLLEGGSQALAIETALIDHYDLTIVELEHMFIEALQAVWLESEYVLDVRASVAFYDTVRRYQNALDPSAFFLTAWLPDNAQMRERGIVADYLRRPAQAENMALELMLVEAHDYLAEDEYQPAQEILNAVNAVLETYQVGASDPFSESVLALNYLKIARLLQEHGYEVRKVSLTEGQARARVYLSDSGPPYFVETQTLEVVLTPAGWSFNAEAGN